MRGLKNRIKKLGWLVVALTAWFGSAPYLTPPADAQGVNVFGVQATPYRAVWKSQIVTAADTSPALYIKYYGPGGASTTTVAVEADSNLTFVVNGAAYTGFECPVSGALGGVIDVSDAACNTLGEVVDVINATATSFSTGYFRAVIAAGARADSSNAVLLADAADTEVLRPEGEVVFWDSSATDDTEVGLWDSNLGVREFISGVRVPSNPFEDRTSVLLWGHEKITNGGTFTNTEVHCTVENYRDGGTPGSEVDTIIYLEAAPASGTAGAVSEFVNAGGLRCDGGKLWMRTLASGADSSAIEMFVTGYHMPRILP